MVSPSTCRFWDLLYLGQGERSHHNSLRPSKVTSQIHPRHFSSVSKLGTKYIGLDSHLVTNPHFVSGVLKTQEERLGDLTEDEKEAVSTLLKGADGATVEDSSDDDDVRRQDDCRPGDSCWET